MAFEAKDRNMKVPVATMAPGRPKGAADLANNRPAQQSVTARPDRARLADDPALEVERAGLDVDTDELVKRMSARKDALFESQQIAPAPSQTYFQIVVYPQEVILRDWPRKRLAQPVAPPGQKAISIKEFLDGELQDQIRVIFGQDVLNNCLRAARTARRSSKPT